MNEEFADLEKELRRLPPTPPSTQLEERLAKALDASRVKDVPRCWWQRLGFNNPWAAATWGLAAPAAALLAFSASPLALAKPHLPSEGVSEPASDSKTSSRLAHGFQPAAASNVLFETRDEGVVAPAGRPPARQVRYRSEDTVEWRDPRTGAQLEVSYPREDVVLVPVSTR